MKLVKPSKIKSYGWWLGMPFNTFALSYILYDERLFTDWRIAAGTYVIIYTIGYLSFFSHEQYDHYIRSKYPSLEETKKRVLYKLPINLFVMTPSILLIFVVFDWFHIFGYSIQEGDLKYGYLVGLAINIIFETLWEVIYILDKYKEAAAEEELLKQMQLEQEFHNLKQKVNPHFLFNCFNTLLSLIAEDKKQAEHFLDELSKVYRYLLKTNETHLSTMEQEIHFIESYSRLLKTRFGESFHIYFQVNAAYSEYLLPSLSLQLLVENAVKHNVLSKLQPISIVIKTTDTPSLVVENTLFKKAIRADSTGIGLKNIKEKYRLLNQSAISIQQTDKHFIVTLPLLPKETAISM